MSKQNQPKPWNPNQAKVEPVVIQPEVEKPWNPNQVKPEVEKQEEEVKAVFEPTVVQIAENVWCNELNKSLKKGKVTAKTEEELDILKKYSVIS